MKKIITVLLIFLIFRVSLAAESESAFCMNKVQGQQLQVADMWLVYTHNLGGNPVLGQFYKCGYPSLDENALTMTEIEIFLNDYGNKLRMGEGNYFLLKQNSSFFILSVNRTSEKLFFKLKNLNEIIHQKDFIYIMIPKKEST